MRLSTLVVAAGLVTFVVPVPVTFVGGALVVVAGVLLRLLGH